MPAHPAVAKRLRSLVCGRVARRVFCGLLLAAAGPLAAQELIVSETGGPVRLFASDGAVLESQEARKDLPCMVTPSKPTLGFDLKFHTGYEIAIPLRELAGDGNQLTIVFRVIPDGHQDDPVYFAQHIAVPPLDDVDRGPASLLGAFDVGEGKYHIDWLMRDRAERVCSFHWDTEVALPPHDRQVALDIPPGAVRQYDTDSFKAEPPVERERATPPLRVKVILNYAPQDSSAAALQQPETSALVSILRGIDREPRIAEFSLVAFNLQQQKVIYRQPEASEIDLPALGHALQALNLGTVDLKRLAQKHPGSEFLSGLIESEVCHAKDTPDAVIFAGPKLGVEDVMPPEALKQIGDVKFPVFYISYNLNPAANPWRDAIGSAVKYLKGMEFTISRPRDLFFAWSDIMGRIVRGKSGAAVAGNARSE